MVDTCSICGKQTESWIHVKTAEMSKTLCSHCLMWDESVTAKTARDCILRKRKDAEIIRPGDIKKGD